MDSKAFSSEKRKTTLETEKPNLEETVANANFNIKKSNRKSYKISFPLIWVLKIY